MDQNNLTPEQIREDVRSRVAELTEREPSEIGDTTLFIEDLEIDSLLAIELMVSLDKHYQIEIPDEEFREVKNINEVVDLVLKYTQNGGSSQASS